MRRRPRVIALTPGVTAQEALLLDRPRAGVYLVTAADGAEAGTVRGDYVIGFTARYLGRTRSFPDVDAAVDEIAAEYERQFAVPLLRLVPAPA